MRPSRRGFTLIELMIVVAILAILAVVAVPAFVKFLRRAKTVEAVDQLDKIHKGAVSYYMRGKVAHGTGAPVRCQFPEAQGMTPDITGKKCCGGAADADGDDRCDVDPPIWNAKVWSALSFELRDQHYFGYSFVSSGTVETAKFTATANADLDCDGEVSTFERYGYGTSGNASGDCEASQASAYFRKGDTE